MPILFEKQIGDKIKEKSFNVMVELSTEIRNAYHELEKKYHGSKWSIEEDALAFLTDAGLVGRLTMSNQNRWPLDGDSENLEYKISECIWWLIVLSKRMNIDINESLNKFLDEKNNQLL